jgi:hypothetical protein
VAYFDTFPPHDDAGTNFGPWGVYPFFGSGIVVVSDILLGPFVLDVTAITTTTTTTTSTPTTTLPERRVTLCHGNGPKSGTIRVDRSAARAHLRHGDVPGACS